jgi:acetylglutamate kinase
MGCAGGHFRNLEKQLIRMNLQVIKIGGNIIDDESRLHSFLSEFAAIPSPKILVHGGGKLATRLGEQLGIPQQLKDGRRITDQETLKVVTMVYAGYVNKTIVALLQSFGCNCLGVSGADANFIRSHKRESSSIDYGFAGDIDEVNLDFLEKCIERKLDLVVAPITHDRKGQLLNTNADTIAQEIAKTAASRYRTELIYVFEKSGVLLNADDDSTVIRSLNRVRYAELKNSGAIFSGMIPKLDNAFSALEHKVSKVIIGKSEHLKTLSSGDAGTVITIE